MIVGAGLKKKRMTGRKLNETKLLRRLTPRKFQSEGPARDVSSYGGRFLGTKNYKNYSRAGRKRKNIKLCKDKWGKTGAKTTNFKNHLVSFLHLLVPPSFLQSLFHLSEFVFKFCVLRANKAGAENQKRH